MELVSANKICVMCGNLIRTEMAYFSPATKNRFRYGLCDPCQQRVIKERRKLGLGEKRSAGQILFLYAQAKYLQERGRSYPEVNYYLELMNRLVVQMILEKKVSDQYSTQLMELGKLEDKVSRISAAESLRPPVEYISRLRSLIDQTVDRSWENRKRNARRLYSKKEAGEIIDKPLDLRVFDIMFDPLE